MAIQIPLTDLAGLLARIPGGALDDPGLGPELGTAETSRAFPVEAGPAGGAAFTVRASSGVALFAFNSSDDADVDGVLGPQGEAGSASSPLSFSPDQAWIKTRMELSADAAGGGELEAGALRADAGARLLLADYRVFGREESVRTAVASALTGARFAVRAADVLELRPGEALSVQLSGALSARVSVRWADVLGRRLSLLRRFVGEGEVIELKISAAARFSATVRVRDEFLLVFSRNGEAERFRVSLRKVRVKGLEGGLDLGVEAEFDDPGQVERAVSEVAGSLLGASEERVRGALARALGGAADPEDAALLDALLRRFGAPDLAALVVRVDELKRELGEAVARLARNELEVGFRYEYRRVGQEESVLDATMDADALREHHAALVRARLEPVLDAVRGGDPRVSLERFLGRRELESTQSWGFSLGVGRWSAGGSDAERVRSVEQRDAAGRRRVAYRGMRGYRGSWGGREFEWAGDFDAAMDAFSAGPVPLVAEYGFGIHLLWRSTVPALTERGLREQLDTALIWEVFPQYALGEVEGRLRESVGASAEFVTRLRADDGALRALLRAPALSDRFALAGPLGAAIPWLSGEPGREDVVGRRSLYAPLWAEYLKKPEAKPDTFARAADEYLRRRMHEPALASRERGFAASRPFTFAGLIELNPGTAEAGRNFLGGLERLRDALAAERPDDGVVAELFRSLSAFWEQSLHVRASGALLLDLARAAGSLDAVERTLTVTSPDATVVIGS